jgi:hypothetical protein
MTNNKQQTPVEWLAEKTFNQIELLKHSCINEEQFLNNMLIFREQAKEMENEKHEKFNKFLNDEKQFGISDLKTVERIQWYYNTYFNETYIKGEQ